MNKFNNKKIFSNKSRQNDGFTLIELLVSVALFSIVIMIAMSSILTTIDVNRKSQTLTAVINDLNFALESMTRTIKTSTQIESYGSQGLVFRDQEGKFVGYKLDGSTIVKCEAPESSNSAAACNQPTPIISSMVKIEKFSIEAIDLVNSGNNYTQPRFLMNVSGYAQITEKTRSDFDIQTTISPRTVNFGNVLN